MQKFGEVKFSKDRVKIQIWGNHPTRSPIYAIHSIFLFSDDVMAFTRTQKQELFDDSMYCESIWHISFRHDCRL